MGIQEAIQFPATTEANPYTSQASAAYELFKSEIDSTSGWEPIGDKDGVKLEKKGAVNGTDLPLVRGTCVVEGVTTDALIPLIQLSGIRKLWDPRFADAWILRRFDPLNYAFYNLGKAPPGLGWIVSPRDITGISTIYVDGSNSGFTGSNKEIVIIQASAKDDQRAPETKGRTRMNLTLNGWRLTPQGNDVRVDYINKVDLGGKLPSSAVGTIANDLPTASGRLRDVYYEHGHPPYIAMDPNGSTRSTLETEFFSLSGPEKQSRQT